jgi:queuine/archaeosine tRNA-ribosyltransferase
MERELQMLNEAQRLIRLAENNLNYKVENIDMRKLTILRKELNEFIREFQYSEEYQRGEE